MKYEKEVKELLTTLFRADWMDDNDWIDFLKEFNSNVVTIEKLSSDLEIGINNGHSLDTQLKLVGIILSSRN